MTEHTEQHTIDARGKRIGRVATAVATLLMGKHRTDAARNTIPDVHVTVEHAGDLLIDERKRTSTMHDRYTGYPDGRRVLSMDKIIERKGYGELVRMAVYGMLPNNKLRAPRMKRLTVTD